MTHNELPSSKALFTIASADGAPLGIGNAIEIREMVADGILPEDIILAPALHKGAHLHDPA